MRHAIKIEVSQSIKGSTFHWRELGWSDAKPLKRFFDAVLEKKVCQLIAEDRRNAKHVSREDHVAYRNEAVDIMFALRGFKKGIHQLLPQIAAPLASVIRLAQPEGAAGKGLLGYHFVALWSAAENEILAVNVLEKNKAVAEAELSYWKHPTVSPQLMLQASTELLKWSNRIAGYQHYVIHVPQKTRTQRGNERSVRFAKKLGFKVVGLRPADDSKGNGKDTLILRCKNWTPHDAPKRYLILAL